MGETILICSGKGGVGKSTAAYFTGLALAESGRKALIIELDSGLRSLDIMARPQEEVLHHLGDVLSGKTPPSKAILHASAHRDLHLLTAPFLAGQKIDSHRLTWLCDAMKKFYDYIFLDAPAGIGYGFQVGLRAAQNALIVTTPDPVAARDGGVVCDMLHDAGVQNRRLIINKLDARQFAASPIEDLDDIVDTVGAQLIGVVPLDDTVALVAAGGDMPLNATPARQAYQNIAKRMEGHRVPLLIR